MRQSSSQPIEQLPEDDQDHDGPVRIVDDDRFGDNCLAHRRSSTSVRQCYKVRRRHNNLTVPKQQQAQHAYGPSPACRLT